MIKANPVDNFEMLVKNIYCLMTRSRDIDNDLVKFAMSTSHYITNGISMNVYKLCTLAICE